MIETMKWKEIDCNNVKCFQYGDDPELIYIVKTGFKNKYMVLYEDAYQLNIGHTKILSREDIKEQYNIEL